MVTGNSINANSTGLAKYDGAGTWTGVTVTQYDVLVGAASNGISSIGPGSSGQVLQSAGNAANPAYSTPTYPSGSGTSGKVLISDGTNVVYSTPTFPNASATSGKIIISDGTNWVATTATYPTTTTINQILYSSAANTIAGITAANNGVLISGTGGIPSWLAAGTTGQVLIATTSNPASWGTLSSIAVTSISATAPVTASASTGSVTIALTTPLALNYGGTNANLTASNGGIFYSTASAGAILSGTATANQVLLSGASTTPAWSTATYPATTTINQVLYSSSANVIAGISAVNNGVLISGTSGIPSFLANGTTGQVLTATTGSAPSWSTLGTGVTSIAGTANQITASASTGAVTLSFPAIMAIGTSSSAGAATQITLTATKANALLITGTQVDVDAGNNQAGILLNPTLKPTNGATAVSTLDVNGLFWAPTSQTITNASEVLVAADFSSNQGTVTNYRGIYIPAAVAGGTVTNGYSLYVAAPGVGSTVATGAYLANVAIGSYTATSPPSNGLIVSGNTSIGSSSAAGQFNVGSSNQFQINSSGVVTNGTWNATAIVGQYGGTGVANTGLTINLSSGAASKVLTSDSSGNGTWGLASQYLLASNILGSAVASVTFSSIPGTYNHLRLIIIARVSDAGNGQLMSIQANADTTAANYIYDYIAGDGGAPAGGNGTNAGFYIGNVTASGATANQPGSYDIIIPGYALTTFYKSCLSRGQQPYGSPSNQNWITTAMWKNTAAITSLKVIEGGAGNFIIGSAFYLYGIV